MRDAVAVARRTGLPDSRLLASLFVDDVALPIAAVAVGIFSVVIDALALGAPVPSSLGRSIGVPPLAVFDVLSSGWLATISKLALHSCFLLFLGSRLAKSGLLPQLTRSVAARGVIVAGLLAVGVACGLLVAIPSTLYLASLREQDPGILPLMMLLAAPLLVLFICATLGQMVVRVAAGLSLIPRLDGPTVGRIVLSMVVWLASMKILRDASQDPAAYLLGFVLVILQAATVAGVAVSAGRRDGRSSVLVGPRGEQILASSDGS